MLKSTHVRDEQLKYTPDRPNNNQMAASTFQCMSLDHLLQSINVSPRADPRDDVLT